MRTLNGGGRQVGGRAVRGGPDQDPPAVLGGPTLDPEDVVAVDPRLAQAR